jgi:hypothetical protein
MSVNILTYMLAASLIQGGMNWKQAVATVFLGNTIVLIPMLLNSHPGSALRHSISRAGARVVRSAGRKRRRSLARLVACGWFGIQTWIGGEAINTLITTLAPAWGQLAHGAAICFWRSGSSISPSFSKASNTFDFCRESARRFCWRWVCYCWGGPINRRADSARCSRRRRAS